MGDVNDDRHLGIERERRRARAREGDLLLHDGDRDDVARGPAGLGDEPRGLLHDEGPEAVVHGARDDPVVGQLDRLAGDHGHVADAHEGARLVAVFRADVDVEVLDIGDLLSLLLLEQVDGLLADDARQVTVAGDDLDALADEDLPVPAADAREVQVALVVDVRDDEADLVDVSDERETRAVADGGDARPRGAECVAADLGEAPRRLPPHAGRCALVARGTGGGEQGAEQIGEWHGPED